MPAKKDRIWSQMEEEDEKQWRQRREAQEAARKKEEKRHKKQEQQRADAKRQQYQKKVPGPPPPPTVSELRAQLLTVLGLKPEQDNSVAIRSAYRRLALQYHPDKNPSKDTTEIFRKILEAYQTLVGE